MHRFIETISTFGAITICIVLAVIVLSLFFHGVSWIKGSTTPTEQLTVRGVLKKNAVATVHCRRGIKFEKVRFVGFTRTDGVKNHFPYQLSEMVVIEEIDSKRRIMIKANDIKMIEIPPDSPSARS